MEVIISTALLVMLHSVLYIDAYGRCYVFLSHTTLSELFENKEQLHDSEFPPCFRNKELVVRERCCYFMKSYSNKTVIDSLKLPLMTNFEELTEHLRLSAKLVYWLTSDSTQKYQIYRIPKKDGSFRVISAPVYSLKVVQRWVLDNILYKIKVSPYSFGFIKDGKGSPLVQCAEKHKNNLYVLKIDIRNFYPSIKREKVYYEFTNIGYNSTVANLLTNICVYNNTLPQGAVTSAYLANIICRNLDFRIAGYCNRRDIVYTRYADDLTFSSDNRVVLKSIYKTIRKILLSEGFQLNEKKTLFLSPRCRKRVLGVTINDNLIKAPKELKRSIRAMIYNSFLTQDYTSNAKIKGYISYVDSIEPGFTIKVKDYVTGLYKSEFTLIQSVVDAYNSNKFYSEMPNMKLRQADYFIDVTTDDEDEFLAFVNMKYADFLSSRGIKSNEIKISDNSQDDTPF